MIGHSIFSENPRPFELAKMSGLSVMSESEFNKINIPKQYNEPNFKRRKTNSQMQKTLNHWREGQVLFTTLQWASH